jgi:hypothetical protein
MTDLREKVACQLYTAMCWAQNGPTPNWNEALQAPKEECYRKADAIMSLVQPVRGADLLTHLRAMGVERVDDLTEHDCTLVLHASGQVNVQPVVTDEMVSALKFRLRGKPVGAGDGNTYALSFPTDADIEAALTAALPHAVTRDDVLEELAVEADANFAREYPDGTPRSASFDAQFADRLRSRKGGA